MSCTEYAQDALSKLSDEVLIASVSSGDDIDPAVMIIATDIVTIFYDKCIEDGYEDDQIDISLAFTTLAAQELAKRLQSLIKISY